MRTVAYFGDHLSFSTLVPEDEGRIEGEQNFPKFSLLPSSHSLFPVGKRIERKATTTTLHPFSTPLRIRPSKCFFPPPLSLSPFSERQQQHQTSPIFLLPPPFRKTGESGGCALILFQFPPPSTAFEKGGFTDTNARGGEESSKGF